MPNRAACFLLLPLFLSLSGCAEKEPVDIGHSERIGAALSDYAGGWEGYAEAYTFEDGSDAIRLFLDEDGSGVLEFGERDPLPPPDPDRLYPPSADPNDLEYDGLGHGEPYSGFSYSVAHATVEDERIRLSASSYEVFREWCGLQTPVLDELHMAIYGQAAYRCVPNTEEGTIANESGCYISVGTPDGYEYMPVDCGKLTCRDVCICEESGCAVDGDDDDYSDIELDAALSADGETLEGTLLLGGSSGVRITVRMTRIP